jgi:hypothetical protein
MNDPLTPNEQELIERVRAISVTAPEHVHEHVRGLIAGAERPAPRTAGGARRHPLAGLLGLRAAGAMAAGIAVAIAVAVIAATSSSPRLSAADAAALTLRPAKVAAPREDPQAHQQLTSAVDGIRFPYWDERFGWRSTGARTDHEDGRTITTVFYGNSSGQKVGYAIVGGTPPPRWDSGTVHVLDGTRYRLSSGAAGETVMWVRDGRLCIVAGRGVSGGTLLALASWHDDAA